MDDLKVRFDLATRDVSPPAIDPRVVTQGGRRRKAFGLVGATSFALVLTLAITFVTSALLGESNELEGGEQGATPTPTSARFQTVYPQTPRNPQEVYGVLEIDTQTSTICSTAYFPWAKAAQVHERVPLSGIDPVYITIFEPPARYDSPICRTAVQSKLARIIEEPHLFYVDYHQKDTGGKQARSEPLALWPDEEESEQSETDGLRRLAARIQASISEMKAHLEQLKRIRKDRIIDLRIARVQKGETSISGLEDALEEIKQKIARLTKTIEELERRLADVRERLAESDPGCSSEMPLEVTYLPDDFSSKPKDGPAPGARAASRKQAVIHFVGERGRFIEIRRPATLFAELALANDAPTLTVLGHQTASFGPVHPGGDDYIVQFTYRPGASEEACAEFSLDEYGSVSLDELFQVAQGLRPN